MDIAREERQRKEFRDILFELAKSQDLLQESYARSAMYKRFEDLYYDPEPDKKFRHFYSDIFLVLTQVQQDPTKGDINILGQNLSIIRAGYKTKNIDANGKLIDVSDSIKKIYDHVSLDMARMLYSEAADRAVSGEQAVIDLQTQVNSIKNEVEIAQKKQNTLFENIEQKVSETERKLQNSEKEYITILGIFASIVLAFTGGMCFSTSVFEHMHSVSIYRAIIVCLLMGLILIDLIYLLLSFIRDINGISKKKSHITVIIINIGIVGIIILTVIAMKYHWLSSEVFHIVEFVLGT